MQVLTYARELERPTQRLGRLTVDHARLRRDRLLAATQAEPVDENNPIGGLCGTGVQAVLARAVGSLYCVERSCGGLGRLCTRTHTTLPVLPHHCRAAARGAAPLLRSQAAGEADGAGGLRTCVCLVITCWLD